MFEIGYLQVEAIVAEMSGLSDRAMIRRRSKYLQRMSFPPRSNTGRGRRTLLNLEQLLQVALALELMQIGASPTRTVRILRTNWDQLRPALALGWLANRKPMLAPLRDLLVMNAGAFEDARGSEDPHEPVAQPLRPLPVKEFATEFATGGATTRVVVDPSRLASNLIHHASTEGAAFSRDELDAAFIELWTAEFDTDPDEWKAMAVPTDRRTTAELPNLNTASEAGTRGRA